MDKENKALYFHMAIFALLGAIIAGALGYAWAIYRNNLNPVAGVGLAVLMTLGMVIGAVIGIFEKRTNE